MNAILVKETLLQYLHQTESLVRIVQRFESSQPRLQIYTAKLADDMLPFYKQVEVTANFAVRACCALLDKKLDYFALQSADFEGTLNHLKKSREFVERASIEYGNESESTTSVIILDKAGEADLRLERNQYLLKFALPNLFFHMTCAYAIARHHGCPLGKRDFDGLHDYS